MFLAFILDVAFTLSLCASLPLLWSAICNMLSAHRCMPSRCAFGT